MRRTRWNYIFVLLVIPIIVFIIEMWAENDSQDFYNEYIKNIVMFKIPIFNIPVIGVIFFGAIAHLYYESRHKSLIDEYNQEKEKMERDMGDLKKDNTYLKNQLTDSARIMWRNYQQIMKIKDKEVLNNVIKNFVKREKYIYGIQLYSYSKNIIEKEMVIKINHKDGYVGDGVSLNALLQTYYRVNIDIYNNFVAKVRECGNLKAKTQDITKFIERCIAPIKSKLNDNINSKDANHYAVALLSTQMICSNINKMKGAGILGKENKSKENKLLNQYRTGILRGILYQLPYLFKHESSGNTKSNRLYLSLPFYFLEEQCIFIVALSDELLKDKNFVNYIDEISKSIVSELKSKLESEYDNVNKVY